MHLRQNHISVFRDSSSCRNHRKVCIGGPQCFRQWIRLFVGLPSFKAGTDVRKTNRRWHKVWECKPFSFYISRKNVFCSYTATTMLLKRYLRFFYDKCPRVVYAYKNVAWNHFLRFWIPYEFGWFIVHEFPTVPSLSKIFHSTWQYLNCFPPLAASIFVFRLNAAGVFVSWLTRDVTTSVYAKVATRPSTRIILCIQSSDHRRSSKGVTSR